MNKRKIATIVAALFMAVTLFLTASAFIQFLSAKNTQDNSAYVNGTVTDLTLSRPTVQTATRFNGPTYVVQVPGYYVSYNFIPKNSTHKYSKTYYGINESQYGSLNIGGSIKVYYNAQNPNLNNPNGDQSSSGQLETLTIIFGALFVVSLIVFILLKNHKQNPQPTYNNGNYPSITPTIYPTVDNAPAVVVSENENNNTK
jgi:preprotein translocase subunit SecG